MENRRTLYYSGNTIKDFKVDKEKKDKIKSLKHDEQTDDKIMLNFNSKQFATSKCVWCDANFPEGIFAIVCHSCGNCQYCGLMTDCNDLCRHCGNQLPFELKREKKRFVI